MENPQNQTCKIFGDFEQKSGKVALQLDWLESRMRWQFSIGSIASIV